MSDSEMWGDLEQAALAGERAERADRASFETEGALMHLQLRTMTRVAWEAMQRGDAVRCSWLGGSLTGVPTAAIGDLIVVPAEPGLTALRVPALSAIQVVETQASSGASGNREVESFHAWLAGLETQVPTPSVVCHLVGGEDIAGVLQVVAQDHLLVIGRGANEAAVAVHQLAAVSLGR